MQNTVTVLEIVTSPTPAPAASTMIVDFGDKIHGARKDIWGKYAAAMQAGLPADMADFTMAKHFPEPDYAAAIANGADVESLATMKALRDLIPAKPRRSYKLSRWILLVKMAHGITQRMAAEGFKISPARLDEICAGVGGEVAEVVKLYRRLGFPHFTRASGWKIESGTFFTWNGYPLRPGGESVYYASKDHRWQAQLSSKNPVREAAYSEVLELLKARIGEELAEGPSERKTAFALYQNRYLKTYFIGKKCARGVVRLKEGFDTASAARAVLENNRAELEAIWAEKSKTPMLRKAANEPRQGPARRTGNVSPEMFMAIFGFRGVQFGNYVEADRRQSDLNEAHDALLDLAEALSLPPAALSLGGSLGMAFGARGTGGYKAHYEPGQIVINITKTHGPGSLAHEWFHALDNYLARLDAGRTGSIGKYITADLVTANELRTEVLAGFVAIRQVLSRGTFASRSDELDTTRSKPYFGTTIEKAARAFEIFLTDRLAAADIYNDYLANIYKGTEAAMEWNLCAYPFPREMDQDGIRETFARAFNTLKAEGNKIY